MQEIQLYNLRKFDKNRNQRVVFNREFIWISGSNYKCVSYPSGGQSLRGIIFSVTFVQTLVKKFQIRLS